MRNKQLKIHDMTDCSSLSERDIRNQYTVAGRNKFGTLLAISDRRTPNDEYENCINPHIESPAEPIPAKLKAKYNVSWESIAVIKNEIMRKMHPYLIKETLQMRTRANL